ncbi:uncharacterized protein LOC107003692 [Solanum pennellii]|uniref:Uncharacterized protein LOC107003692 n=1 Tax=Solanum pennellii TaxID=28526 RepID=A0ABM1FIW5_SOLPN|nr:uncharacterized protein LOC107003692 [Solanum pennellii]
MGYHFHPSAKERLQFLLRFVAKSAMNDDGLITTNLDVYGEEEPLEIYSQGVPTGGLEADDDDYSYRYFITKKNNNNGNWKQQGEEIPVFFKIGNVSTSLVMGTKKKMHYVHEFGHWIMKQYELSPVFFSRFGEDRKEYVLCAMKREYIDECTFDDPQPADEDV